MRTLALTIGYGMLLVWGFVGLGVVAVTLHSAVRAHLRRWRGQGKGPTPEAPTGQLDSLRGIADQAVGGWVGTVNGPTQAQMNEVESRAIAAFD